jgi:uncharacterized protein YecT (DUF1311 family)
MLLGMRRFFSVALLLLAFAARLFAQRSDADNGSSPRCKEYLKTPLPAEAATVPAPKAWPDCDSHKLYSGIGSPVDFVAARKCAWRERLASQAGFEPRYTVASIFGGAPMLTVLYANGEGADKNLPLALRFACEAGGAPAEVSTRLDHIESLATRIAIGDEKLNFCDDITSGFMEGFCAASISELADQKRSRSLDAISAQMSPVQREAFLQLVNKEEAYSRAHAIGEIDLSGTARAMFQIDAEQTLRDDFLAALQSFESGKVPDGSARAYKDADARLNLAYQKAIVIAEVHRRDYGAVQPSGIRNAERAWLKYRNAWKTFAKLRYPGVLPEAWLILLTNDRTSILDGSFCDMDAVDGPCVQKGDTWKPSPLP